MSYMRDYRGRRLDSLSPSRDLPGVVGHWDASQLSQAVGASIALLPDSSGQGNHLVQTTSANRPTVASGPGGLKVLAQGSTGYLIRTGLGSGDWMAPAGYAQPVTFVGVVKAPAATPGTQRYIFQSGNAYVGAAVNTGSAYTFPGTSTITGGPNLLDGQWHVVVAVLGTTGVALYLDGNLVGSTTNAGGTAALLHLGWGANATGTAGTFPLQGWLAEAIMCAAALTPQQVAKVSQSLGAKWGISIGADQAPATAEDTTSSNGQNVRIWEPPTLAAGAPLVLYAHNYTGNEQIAANAGGWFFPLMQASVAKGWRVAGTRQHGDSWGNQNSIDDLVDLYNLMNTRQAVTKVLIVGSSMGGLSAALAVPDGLIPVKGVALQDAVLNLADVYAPAAGFTNYASAVNTAYGITAGTLSGATTAGATSLPTTASFPTIGTQLRVGYGTANAETVTTTGASTGTTVAVTALTNAHASGEAVSDYPTKTVGHDPSLIATASFTGNRWRFYQSTGDTTNVNPANNGNAFATKIAAAIEAGVVTHAGGHLSTDVAQPADFVAFAARCFA